MAHAFCYTSTEYAGGNFIAHLVRTITSGFQLMASQCFLLPRHVLCQSSDTEWKTWLTWAGPESRAFVRRAPIMGASRLCYHAQWMMSYDE